VYFLNFRDLATDLTTEEKGLVPGKGPVPLCDPFSLLPVGHPRILPR